MKKNIVLFGLKSAGKSSVGHALAQALSLPFVDSDQVIEDLYFSQTQQKKTFQEIHKVIGEQAFRALEALAIQDIVARDVPMVIATGGSSLLNANNVASLSKNTVMLYLQASQETLLARWRQHPPSFINPNNIIEELQAYYLKRAKCYEQIATNIVTVDNRTIEDIVDEVKTIFQSEGKPIATEPRTQ